MLVIRRGTGGVLGSPALWQKAAEGFPPAQEGRAVEGWPRAGVVSWPSPLRQGLTTSLGRV